ncbi:exportin-2-like, partial [Sitophilus oryzae]|uniref:Exportin-2-like n=1 Tax=Sitophilus oryzae TaxID=7048 RepID=A0A6J2XUZ0_SITOR
NELPVLKADAIKYIMTFRSVLPNEVVVSTLPQLIRHLQSESAVVHTYAACAIEKILIMKDSNNQAIVSGGHIQPFAKDLISQLLEVLERPVSEENEYIMKALMRTFSTLQELVIPYLGVALPKLTEILKAVTKNPSRPHFNHYLFETFSLSVRIVCKSNQVAVKSFEDILFPIFQGILQQDVQEFIPYVFQVLSLLLDYTPSGSLSDAYMQLLPCLLAPVLWERPANISPLVRLLRSLVSQAAQQIIAQDKLAI